MSLADKTALLAKRGLGTLTVSIGEVGEVEVRGLTRAEALSLQGSETDAAAMEQKMIAMAMTKPSLTEEEVAQWQQVAPAGELEPIAEAITELSGLAVAQVKAEMQAFRS